MQMATKPAIYEGQWYQAPQAVSSSTARSVFGDTLLSPPMKTRILRIPQFMFLPGISAVTSIDHHRCWVAFNPPRRNQNGMNRTYLTQTCTQEVGLDYYLCQCPVVSREEGKPEVLSAIAGEFRT